MTGRRFLSSQPSFDLRKLVDDADEVPNVLDNDSEDESAHQHRTARTEG